ncbi:Hypothetical_protein [Hexamita inflata]|uniref:Hypothetical_protein n=1 Tax=Hexamita inflata TaxID=28002 RepID=A0ABP1GGJ6_9EUKA
MDLLKSKLQGLNQTSPNEFFISIDPKYKLQCVLTTIQKENITYYEPLVRVSPTITFISIFGQSGEVTVRSKYYDLSLLAEAILQLIECVKLISLMPQQQAQNSYQSSLQSLLVDDYNTCQQMTDTQILEYLKKKQPIIFNYDDHLQKVSASVTQHCELVNQHMELFKNHIQQQILIRNQNNEGKKYISKSEINDSLSKIQKELKQEIQTLESDTSNVQTLCQKVEEQFVNDAIKQVQW